MNHSKNQIHVECELNYLQSDAMSRLTVPKNIGTL